MAKPVQTEEQKVEELAKVLHLGVISTVATLESREVVPWDTASEDVKNSRREEAKFLRRHWQVVSDLLV